MDEKDELKQGGVPVDADHMAKQRKRKDLTDEYVYGSQKGVVEMHKLGDFVLSAHEGKTINKIFQDLKDENAELKKRLDIHKEVNKALLDRIKIIEGKMEKYGLH